MPGVGSGKTNSLNYNNTTDYGGAGTHSVPVWVEIDRVSDVNRAGSKSVSQINIRSSETTIDIPGNKTRTISFTYYKVKGVDSVFAAIEKSFELDTILDIWMAEDDVVGTGAVAGTKGKRGPFRVTKLDKSEPIEGAETYEVELGFADAEISAGVPFLWVDFNAA